MKHRLFNLLAGVSLVLCVATAILWASSFEPSYFDRISFDRQSRVEREWGVWINDGRFCISYGHIGWPPQSSPLPKPQGWQLHHEPQWLGQNQQYFRETYPDNWHVLSFYAGRMPAPASWKVWGFCAGFNLLIPFVLLSILPITWRARFLWGKRRILERRCLSCGYDLRASPKRCQECGTVPANLETAT